MSTSELARAQAIVARATSNITQMSGAITTAEEKIAALRRVIVRLEQTQGEIRSCGNWLEDHAYEQHPHWKGKRRDDYCSYLVTDYVVAVRRLVLQVDEQISRIEAEIAAQRGSISDAESAIGRFQAERGAAQTRIANLGRSSGRMWG